MSHYRFTLVLLVTVHTNYHPTAYLKTQLDTNQLILSTYAYYRPCALHFPLTVKKMDLTVAVLPQKDREITP